MSYDIYLVEKATGKTIELPIKHVMIGGTCAADYDETTSTFSVMRTADAWLNITYNYSKYYSEAAKDDETFGGVNSDGEYANLGIRGIYGKTGLELIPMLKRMADKIQNVAASESIEAKDYWTATAANAVKPIYQLLVFAELRPDGVWTGD